ncbi:hypothetical protein FB451DRAFT_1163755 [Mycena latifolia]|nr:hypothetical protein FB451DRAFT_1163755 [Mycena latifolia]
MNFLAVLLASSLAVATANIPRNCLTLPFLCDGGIDQELACIDAWQCPGNGLHPVISNATCAAQLNLYEGKHTADGHNGRWYRKSSFDVIFTKAIPTLTDQRVEESSYIPPNTKRIESEPSASPLFATPVVK